MADSNDERATIARLADEVVPSLIERLAKSDLGELEVRQDGWRIRLRRGSGKVAVDGHAGPPQMAHKPSAVAHASDAHPPRRESPRGQVTSPAVGYFAPRDGVAVGSNLRAGDLIGAVDVLGVRQEVVSPIDGVLKMLEVESGQAVEYGQPIGRVDAGG
jgi:acetyl-CoA carboxylase biotin carboxyl carrier protein